MNNQPTYQIMPALSPGEYEELKADIEARGVMIPIEFDQQGNVLDGHHRLKICEELGITEYPEVFRYFKTEEEKRFHARKLNSARRHMTQEQRRVLIREQLAETPAKSDRQIAAGLGVHHTTVGTQRQELESIGEISQCQRETADGRTYPAQRKPVLTKFNPTTVEKNAIKENGPLIADKLEKGISHDFTDARYKAGIERFANTPPAPEPIHDPREEYLAKAYKAADAFDKAISHPANLSFTDDDCDYWRENIHGPYDIDRRLKDLNRAMENLTILKTYLHSMKKPQISRGG